jgi:hypothetical protein
MVQRKIQVTKSKNSQARRNLSACDIMSNSATKIIGKMESLLPTDMQMYSDFYREYLHSLQDLFGACYISEKEIVDKIGIDPRVLEYFDSYTKAITTSTISQIEMTNNMQKAYFQSNMSAIKTFDEYVRLMLDYYAKMLSDLMNFPFQKS